MSWLDCLLEATDDAETPRSYIYWSGLSTIAAVCGPNVWINRQGVYQLKPNLFVMLIGESGLGKGLPIFIAKKLVKMVNATRVISGRNTMASILKQLNTTVGDKENKGKPKFKDSRGFIVSGEFATLLQEDKQALSILTDLYDGHWNDEWDNSTKNSGIDNIRDVNITLFGGSTPEHFSNVVPESDVRGGFVGRILTVVEEKRYRINPLSDTEATQELPFEKLSVRLREVAELKGPFRFTTKAKKLWEDWYQDIRSRPVHDPTGAVNRLPDNVLKVAMCLSMANQCDMLLHRSNIEEAAQKCMTLSIDNKKIVGGKGKSRLGEQTHIVIKALWSADEHYITKQRLLTRYYGQFDTLDLDRIIQTLENAKLVFTIFNSDTNDTVYRLTDYGVEAISQLMEREQ